MLCDRCKKNDANVHITKVINGHKQEQNLCEKCAKETEVTIFPAEFEIDEPLSFQNLLSGIMDYISKGQGIQGETKPKLICENCGTSYEEFKEGGLLGCSKCYEKFSSTLMPVIKRIQGNIEHTGKIPEKAGKDIYNKRLMLKLKEELQKAIVSEEYENAAQIRDKIRELQKEE